MKPPGIFSGIALAFAVGLFTLLLGGSLEPLLGSAMAIRWILVIVQWVYAIYLLRVARPKIGILTLLAFNLFLGVFLLAAPLGRFWLPAAWVGVQSLNRTLLFHRSTIAAGLDGLLALLGWFLYGYLLRESGSLPIALWGFFLVQAGFALIPSRSGFSRAPESPPDPFQHAFRQARYALEAILRQAA